MLFRKRSNEAKKKNEKIKKGMPSKDLRSVLTVDGISGFHCECIVVGVSEGKG